jgi:hypothetical protein
VDVQYKSSWDNVGWSDWKSASNSLITGRYIQLKLRFHSLDGVTNVDFEGATYKVEVNSITEAISSINVSASGWTRVTLTHKFVNQPTVGLFGTDASGIYRNPSVKDSTWYKDVNGYWYADIALVNASDTQVSGSIWGTAFGY